MQEKALEKSQWSKDQHRVIDQIRKENKREMDVSLLYTFTKHYICCSHIYIPS